MFCLVCLTVRTEPQHMLNSPGVKLIQLHRQCYENSFTFNFHNQS